MGIQGHPLLIPEAVSTGTKAAGVSLENQAVLQRLLKESRVSACAHSVTSEFSELY